MKKLHNLTMFIAGDPEFNFPERVFFTYDIKDGKASKTNSLFEVEDPDPEMNVETVWADSVIQIKKNEKIQ